jgi:simple sugar transport system ATP-binding protein
LIKILSGVHAPDPGGSITMDDAAHSALTPHKARQLGIEVIFQDLSLFPNLTAAENIGIGLELSSLLKPPPRHEIRRVARAAVARLEAHLPLDAPVGQLSVAQRQIVAICRGLAGKARVLFMDEPTASLTRHEVNLLLATVRRLKEQGVSVVFVSHRLDEIVEIADRVTVLRDGRKVGTFPAADINDRRLAELMTGEAIEHKLSARTLGDGRPVLEVQGATRAGEFEDVSLTIHAGEILGLIGLLGAGRTELALTLFGMTRLDSGTIAVDGVRRQGSSNADAIAAGISYVSEDRLSFGVNLRQSIADNIAITVLADLRNRIGLIPSGVRASLAKSWVGQLNIRTAGVEIAAQTLSGGNQQRVVLAKWLATRPKVLILDGPTIGVDIRNKAGIHKLVRSLADAGMAILLISDEVPEVYYNCDRVLHMRNGRIAGEFVPGTAGEAQLSRVLYA